LFKSTRENTMAKNLGQTTLPAARRTLSYSSSSSNSAAKSDEERIDPETPMDAMAPTVDESKLTDDDDDDSNDDSHMTMEGNYQNLESVGWLKWHSPAYVAR
jgi:hypothetical protein